MQNRMQRLRWKTAALFSFAILFGGMGLKEVFSQQLANVAGPSSPKADTDPKPVQTEKAEDSVKPLTSRPDPRRSVVPDKTEPKTEKQKADERKAREAARKRGEMTFDDLKFDIEKGAEFKSEMITKNLKELDKKTFTLRGFILPTSVFQQSGIKQFVLVRDNQECCFGPGAAIYDCVVVEMAPGKSTNFATRVVTVKGKFEIDTESFQDPDGGHYAIFKMTADEVK
jgi:hypothetical protein